MKEYLLLLLLLGLPSVIAQDTETASFISQVTLVGAEPRMQDGYNITTFTFEINYQLYNPESSSKTYNIYKDCDGTSIDLYFKGNTSEYHEYTCSRAEIPRVLPPGLSDYAENKSIQLITNNTYLPMGSYEFTAFAPLSGGQGSYILTVENNTSTLTSINQPANYPNGTADISSIIGDLSTSAIPLDSTILFWIPVIFLMYPILRSKTRSKFN